MLIKVRKVVGRVTHTHVISRNKLDKVFLRTKNIYIR